MDGEDTVLMSMKELKQVYVIRQVMKKQCTKLRPASG
jgi:hypothetical protein